MSFSREWTDYHLTPKGWIEGSTLVDFGNRTNVDPPFDRVQTYRWEEEQTSGYSKMHKGGEITWESDDKNAIQELRSQFGEPPNSL
jgi:hypothetical protein